MYSFIISAICIFIMIKTFAYGVWCFKNTGRGGSMIVFIMAVLSLSPIFVYIYKTL